MLAFVFNCRNYLGTYFRSFSKISWLNDFELLFTAFQLIPLLHSVPSCSTSLILCSSNDEAIVHTYYILKDFDVRVLRYLRYKHRQNNLTGLIIDALHYDHIFYRPANWVGCAADLAIQKYALISSRVHASLPWGWKFRAEAASTIRLYRVQRTKRSRSFAGLVTDNARRQYIYPWPLQIAWNPSVPLAATHPSSRPPIFLFIFSQSRRPARLDITVTTRIYSWR